MRIAIVGTGVAGLTAAYQLHREHELTLFERAAHVGGHANTVVVADGGRELGLDTGFLVYNEVTYPHFTRLLRDLDVPTQSSEMSFSVQCAGCRVEYGLHSLRGLFARPDQIVRPRFHRMVFEILRFNRLGRAWLESPTHQAQTLGEFVAANRLSRDFLRHYITPMVSAIWSASTADAERLPLAFFLRFFANHGLLTATGQPQWRTVTGGSRRYVAALTRPFADRIRTQCGVAAVRRTAAGVEVKPAGGDWLAFDRLILATHSDQALRLLADPDPAEAAALGALRYQRNDAVLHTDPRVLPRNRHAWASWNYHMGDCRELGTAVPVTYLLNRLQRLDTPTQYCVTLNDAGQVDPARVLERIPYEHPVYTTESLAAQDALRERNGTRQTYYCGAYLGSGFHEDGVKAGLEVARALAAQRKAA